MHKLAEKAIFSAVDRTTSHPQLARFIDQELSLPSPFVGYGEIRLVILGQDPTVKNVKSRPSIRTVLNLDKEGSLKRYIQAIVGGLGMVLDRNVYATNLLKPFFLSPPASTLDDSQLRQLADIWAPVLIEELTEFPDVPLLLLGQPLLRMLALPGASMHVRHYWGYVGGWKHGSTGPLLHLGSSQNRLGRDVFPFPHQPSITKRFYSERLPLYIEYVKQQMAG